MKKEIGIAAIVIAGVVVLVGGCIWLNLVMRTVDNKVDYAVHKIDESSRYDLLREVENTARAMVSSYKSDLATYATLKDSEKESELTIATAAKIRANRTATTYNEYILKNSFVWEDNIPSDIDHELPLVE